MALYALISLVAIALGYGVVASLWEPAEMVAATSPGGSRPWYETQTSPPSLLTPPNQPKLHYEEPLPAEVHEPVLNRQTIAVLPPLPPGYPDAGKPDSIAALPAVPAPPKVTKVVPTPPPTPTNVALPQAAPRHETEPQSLPSWRRYAVATGPVGNRPIIAVVIDDLGIDLQRTRRIMALPGPLTLAFLPYMTNPREQTAVARAAGHELMVHVSMEPGSNAADPGPNVLLANGDGLEIRQRLEWALSRFDGYVGINNHMGSKFTTDVGGMAMVMESLRQRGLLFLDSRTTANTVGAEMAGLFAVPFAERTVFLDNENELSYVRGQLSRLEEAARRNGYAIAIGHPRDATVEALATWLRTLEQRGFALVPISTVVARLEAQRVQLAATRKP